MTFEHARNYDLEQAFTWKLGIGQGGRLILGRGWLSSQRGDPGSIPGPHETEALAHNLHQTLSRSCTSYDRNT
jgi:hypothetical protein